MRREIRLELPEGLSFVERVGFRYCVDKTLRASAAAVYWRTVDSINRQRLWMADRLEALHQTRSDLSFSRTRALAAAELAELETPVFPHYSLLEGHDRFSRLPEASARTFQPLHRESCDFPSPAQLFEEIGVRTGSQRLPAQPRQRTAKALLRREGIAWRCRLSRSGLSIDARPANARYSTSP